MEHIMPAARRRNGARGLPQSIEQLEIRTLLSAGAVENSIAAPPPVSAVQLILPMYQYPLSAPGVLSDWWQQALDGASAATPLTVVANPASGPITSANADFPNWI